MPGPGDTQLEAFYRFANRGLREELKDFPVIENTDREIEFQLFREQYYLIEPPIGDRDAAYESITYSSELYVPARLTRRGARAGKRTVYMGSIPLMNHQGTFVVNGIDRVIINQVLRSPGIYYDLEREPNGNLIYTGTIISNWGGKLKLELDGGNRIWVRARRRRKISIQLLPLAMGPSAGEIRNNVCHPDIFDETKASHTWSEGHAVSEFYTLLYSTDGYLPPDRSEELRDKFLRLRFEMGEIGRMNMDKKLDSDAPKDESFLLPKDVPAATDYSIGVGLGMGTTDDMDHLKHRRVRTAADLSQDQFGLALERLADSVRLGIRARRDMPTIGGIINSSLLLTTLKGFFGSHPLSQSLDRTNPLTRMVHKRKLSSLGPGGLTRRTAGSQVRDIHPGHYGRVCPIETAEGMNAGLISSLASYAGVDCEGSLKGPFQRVSGTLLRGRDVATSVSAEDDENYQIAAGTRSYAYRRDRGEEVTAARYRQEFVTIVRDRIHLRNISPLQCFSVGASLIPSLENNDANRTLMGSNMQRQAVPLLRPEKCIVGTGLEGQVASDSTGAAREGNNGCTYGEVKSLPAGSGTKGHDELALPWMPRHGTRLCRGGPLRRGQAALDGEATKGGELALGRNVLVAYMPWEGYNFEDSILISERPISENIYTSIHIDKYETEAQITLGGAAEIITDEIPHSDDYSLRHLDGGLIIPGSWVETGDVLVGKLTPRNSQSIGAPESNSLQAILGLDITAARESCLKVPAGGRGRIIDVRWIHPAASTPRYTRGIVHVYILQEREMQVGDKVAGRHGNKGIVPKIMPTQDLPYLQDGTPIDVMLGPLGVPSRMNVGQIFECVLGLAGYFLGRHHRIVPFDEGYERGASRKLVHSELREACNRTANPWLFESDGPGKSRSLDGRTGNSFWQPVTVGKAYMLKLVHQVDDKIHARSSGPYSRVTQQPLKGKSKNGGQRVGEMEVWASEGFGISNVLCEMPTTKSDHFRARRELVNTVVAGEPVYELETTAPESSRLLVRELRCLALNLDSAIVDDSLISNDRWEGHHELGPGLSARKKL